MSYPHDKISPMTNNDPKLADFIQALPKAEIHIHLEGAIEPETVLELATRHNMLDRLPARDAAGLREWFVFRDFPHFVDIYLTISEMLRTPDDFELIAYRLGADMAAQNILYREATFTPHTHVDFQDKGLSIEDILSGLEAGRQKAKRDFGVEIRWVFDIVRNFSFEDNAERTFKPRPSEATLEYALAGMDRGVVGFGLGGFEVGCPPEPFEEYFAEAKKHGLLSVPHAGETEGPASVRGSVYELQADRIGHGVRAVEDESLLRELIERQIPLEVNPTSNIRLHVFEDFASHPFRRLDEAGAFVTVNSDDPPLFNTTLIQEYQALVDHFGYDRAGIIRIARRAFEAAGPEEDIKQSLLARFDQEARQLGE